MDLEKHLMRQMAFSRATFGPGTRRDGVLDHLEKEIGEVRASGGASDEWVDLVLLALDGLTRQIAHGHQDGIKRRMPARNIAQVACALIEAKQDKNENRLWPDWRTAPADKAMEHEGHDD